jgi:UDP-N-acetylglucosamine:LPS N-acetylglucosamine transferase
MTRILAIASAGGHWQQLMELSSAFSKDEVMYITTIPSLPESYQVECSRIIPDCNRNSPHKMAKSLFALIRIFLIQKPSIVITTGALPGLLAIALGRLFGSDTIWIDSVANSEKLSGSGRLAKHLAHVCVSQWKHVADENCIGYWGSIL